MKTLRLVPSALLCSLLAFACAQTSGGNDPTDSGDGDGDTGTTMLPTGGSTGATGTGGAVVIVSGSGGTTTGDGDLVGDGDGDLGSGGTPMVGGPCMEGETADCADEFPDFPFGTASCSAGAWDVSTCLVCEPDQPVPCSVAEPTLPNGSVTCNSTGLGYVEDPMTECAACEIDSTTDCDDPGNLTENRAGTATCGAGGYDWSECSFCESGDTIACDEVPGNTTLLFGNATCDEAANMGQGDWDLMPCTVCNPAGSTLMDGGKIECVNIVGGAETYTAGEADCNGAGDGWVETSCEYCGDGIVNGVGEVCDGNASVPGGLTCETLDPPFLGSDPVTECTDTCVIDTSPCSACEVGTTTCLGDGNPTDCSNGDCVDAQCGAGFDCTFTCGQNNFNCTGLSCGPNANSCTVTTPGDQVTVDFECGENATCTVGCDRVRPCTVTCQDGSTCSNTQEDDGELTMNCAAGATCTGECGRSKDCAFNCEDGSNCNIVSTNDRARAVGTAYCASGTCSYTFTSRHDHTVAIVCADGATCEFDVGGQDSVANVTCEAGSTCTKTGTGTLTCSGPGCPA